MQSMSGFLSVGSRILLSVFFLALFLQGCTINVNVKDMRADSETPDVNGKAPKVDPEPPCDFLGCAPATAANHSAVGFTGIGGTTPVQVGTCQSGQYCSNPMGTCGLGGKKKCVSTYTYGTQACACTCP